MRITSNSAKDLLIEFLEEILKSDKLEAYHFSQMMYTSKFKIPSNSIIGQIYKDILDQYKPQLDRIEGLSDYWRWGLIRRLIELKSLRSISHRKTIIQKLIDELIEDINKKIEVTSVIYIPFAIPPEDNIKIGSKLTIRQSQEREIKIIKQINNQIDIKNKQPKRQGMVSIHETKLQPNQIVIYEFNLGQFDFDEVMQMIDDRFMADMNKKLDLFSYIPDNPVVIENTLFINALKNYSVVINEFPIKIFREEIRFDTKWINQEMIKQYRFSMMMIDSTQNYRTKENLDILLPNLRILFKLLFEDRINQIRVLMNRFSLIIDTYRSMVDKIVDGMIMFEAICTPGMFGSKSRTIAFRSAMLLEKEEANRYKVYNFILSMYRRRNNVVHGSDPMTILSHDEFLQFFDYSKNLFIIALTIYNKVNYEEKQPNWKKIMSKLDFAGFDTTRPYEEIIGMKYNQK